MTERFAKQINKCVLSQLISYCGWTSASQSSFDALTDIFENFYKELGKSLKAYSEHGERDFITLADINCAFSDMDIHIKDLSEYIIDVPSFSFLLNLPEFPLKAPSNLNFPTDNSSLLPDYVDPYFPKLYQEELSNSESVLNDLQNNSQTIYKGDISEVAINVNASQESFTKNNDQKTQVAYEKRDKGRASICALPPILSSPNDYYSLSEDDESEPEVSEDILENEISPKISVPLMPNITKLTEQKPSISINSTTAIEPLSNNGNKGVTHSIGGPTTKSGLPKKLPMMTDNLFAPDIIMKRSAVITPSKQTYTLTTGIKVPVSSSITPPKKSTAKTTVKQTTPAHKALKIYGKKKAGRPKKTVTPHKTLAKTEKIMEKSSVSHENAAIFTSKNLDTSIKSEKKPLQNIVTGKTIVPLKNAKLEEPQKFLETQEPLQPLKLRLYLRDSDSPNKISPVKIPVFKSSIDNEPKYAFTQPQLVASVSENSYKHKKSKKKKKDKKRDKEKRRDSKSSTTDAASEIKTTLSTHILPPKLGIFAPQYNSFEPETLAKQSPKIIEKKSEELINIVKNVRESISDENSEVSMVLDEEIEADKIIQNPVLETQIPPKQSTEPEKLLPKPSLPPIKIKLISIKDTGGPKTAMISSASPMYRIERQHNGMGDFENDDSSHSNQSLNSDESLIDENNSLHSIDNNTNNDQVLEPSVIPNINDLTDNNIKHNDIDYHTMDVKTEMNLPPMLSEHTNTKSHLSPKLSPDKEQRITAFKQPVSKTKLAPIYTPSNSEDEENEQQSQYKTEDSHIQQIVKDTQSLDTLTSDSIIQPPITKHTSPNITDDVIERQSPNQIYSKIYNSAIETSTYSTDFNQSTNDDSNTETITGYGLSNFIENAQARSAFQRSLSDDYNNNKDDFESNIETHHPIVNRKKQHTAPSSNTLTTNFGPPLTTQKISPNKSSTTNAKKTSILPPISSTKGVVEGHVQKKRKRSYSDEEDNVASDNSDDKDFSPRAVYTKKDKSSLSSNTSKQKDQKSGKKIPGTLANTSSAHQPILLVPKKSGGQPSSNNAKSTHKDMLSSRKISPTTDFNRIVSTNINVSALPTLPKAPIISSVKSGTVNPTLTNVSGPGGVERTVITETLGSVVLNENGEKIWICPACTRPDDGSPMIGCDSCDDWYHWVCVNITQAPEENENWYCARCLAKSIITSYSSNKRKKKKPKKG